MTIEEAFKNLEQYTFVIDFIPDYNKQLSHLLTFHSKFVFDEIKNNILNNTKYYNNEFVFKNDLDIIDAWFNLIALCLNRLNVHKLKEEQPKIKLVVESMKFILNYMKDLEDSLKLMQRLAEEN